MRWMLFSLLTLPLAAQTWDLRFEVPFPQGQNLPQTMLLGSGQLISGELDKGNGGILSVSHRLIRVSPVLRLEWGAEVNQWNANGYINSDSFNSIAIPFADIKDNQLGSHIDSKLKQTGVGLGINAQLWIPFVGVSGEMGVIQRFQRYNYSAEGVESDGTIGRTWLRVGVRWRLPFVAVHPYLSASYQQPINKEHPVHIDSIKDMAGYFTAQGKGQEFQRLWAFGVGVTF
ncbi:MAG: hypothetical protein LBH03_07810 [Holophagales bacterium]|jgi:hypothetical protein|nr:hypothetical protein [Holophagales bacterium]